MIMKMFMIRWLIGIISFVPILFISIRCQTILAPQQLNLDGQDRFLIIFDRSAEDNGQQRLLRAKLLLSFSRSFNHVVYEDEIRTEKSIDEWTLPYVYRPQESSTTSTSKFKSFRFDQIFMKIIIEQPKKSEQIIRQFSIASNWNLGFFQSDKSIYKPSELVHLRFVRLNRLTFKPIVNDQCYLMIKNQQKIKMDFKNLTLKSPEYFLQYSYKLPTILNNNGEWEAEINCPETKYQNSLKFQVNDYVLPRFRIDIEAPPVHLCGSSDKPLIIRLRATYTYGRPVNGYAYFRISIQSKLNNRYPKNQNNNVEQKTPVECLNSTTGSLEQSIILSGNFCKSQQKLPQRLLIEAIVTDLSTNQKETSTINDQTILAKYPYRLWKRFTNLVYRPKLANYLAFELTDHDNNPMANIPIEIQMSDSNDHNIQPYILTSNQNNPDNNLIQTDSNGLIIFTFKLDRNLGPLKVRIRSRDPRYRPDQQMSEEFTIFLFDYVNQIEQQRQPVIQISNKKKIWYKAGQRFRSSLVYDGPIDSNQTYLIIMHHESIIHFSHLNSSTLSIDIPLTNQMAPSIRMLVLAFIQYENRFVADFFRILIRQNNCGVQMKLGRTMVKPGQNLSITFDGGHSGDVLALKAIDESLEILQQKNQSSSALKLDKSLQNIYRKFIPGLDLTNQKSYYRSTDTISLIENFGLQILTPTAVDTTRHIRYRRNIHQCDRLAKNPCCQLAKSKFRQQISCEHRMAILRNHLNATIATTKDCLQAFFQCCQCSTMFGEPILIGQKHSFIFSQNEIRTMSSNVPETFAGRDDFEDDNDGQNLDIKRNDFRDSWLFDIYPLEHRTKTISKMVPHSITSWLISSISISKQDGFCVETPEQKLTVFKSFFIKISMPKSIVQYEQTEISATIYNYHNETLDTVVHFYHVDGLCSDAYRSLDKASTELRLMSNESKTIIYPIIGLRIGQFLIRIKAESGYHYYKDTVEKFIKILPPGETMEYSHSSNLDPTNRSKRNEQMKRDSNEMIDVIDEIYPERKYQKINISIHRDLHNHNHQNNIVTGTIHHRLSLIGERFEPQLKSPEELSHLIRRRKSCGEQTAFYMAFNLHTMIYLKETNRLNRTLRKRGRKHLKRSYNDLISYRKSNDGSFAAFINRESSVWLTAFVSNLFCQSEQFLDDDEFDINMLSKSLDWILRQQQQSSGSWTESSTTTTHIHHRYADGGSNQNDETLTAFVLIALHQCNLFITRNNFTDKLQTNWSIDYVNANHKSFRYLLDEISRTNHSYSMAIILYSLLLSPSSLPFLTKNDRYKWMEHLLQHPDRHQDGKLNQMYFDTGSLTVETTAYVLLGIGCLSDTDFIDERKMLANWLSSRPLYGSIEKTQDTLMTLIALSDYYRSSSSIENNNLRNQFELYTNISFGQRSTGNREKRSIKFDSNSLDHLHMIDMDGNIVDHIEIETIGNGIGRFELLTKYNVYDPTTMELECPFELNVQLFDYIPTQQDDDIDEEDSLIIDDQLIESLQIEKLDEKLQLEQMKRMKNVCRSKIPDDNKTNRTNDDDNRDGASRLKNWQCEQNFQNYPLPLLPEWIENPIIKIIRICTLRKPSDDNDRRSTTIDDDNQMVILETSILSGYQVIEDDLKIMKNNSTIIYWYEIAGSKITFYLRRVPRTYRLCFCFRIYQQNPVNYIQSALVRIYNYHQKESDCRKMYSDINVNRFLNYSCQDDYCQCLIENRCTRIDLFKHIEEEFIQNIFNAFELFKRTICQHRYVLNVIVRFLPLDNDDNNGNIQNNAPKSNFNSSLTLIIESFKVVRKPNDNDDHHQSTTGLLSNGLQLRFEYPCNHLCLDSRILQQAYNRSQSSIRFHALVMFNEIISGLNSSSSTTKASSFVRMDGLTTWHMFDIGKNWQMSNDLMLMLENEGPLQCVN